MRTWYRLRISTPWFCCVKKIEGISLFPFSTVSPDHVNTDEIAAADVEKSSKKKNQVNYSKEILAYLSDKLENPLSYIPEKYIKRYKQPKRMFIVDEEIADHFVNLIQPYLKKNTGCLLEMNPGIGLLSKRLVHYTKCLNLYEPDEHFVHKLQALLDGYTQKVHIHNVNLMYLGGWKTAKDELLSDESINSFFKKIPARSWAEDPPYQIIGVLPNRSLLVYLVRSLMAQRGLTTYGRPELLLVVSRVLYSRLVAKPGTDLRKYQDISVLFQLIFDTELLADDISSKAFLPRFTTTTKNADDREHMCIVRIVGKKDFFEKFPNIELLQPCLRFIRHYMMNRRQCVIPTLEMIVPGCGPRLIAKDYTIFTTFGSLTPKQMFDLFIEFSSWPEYENSHDLFLSDEIEISGPVHSLDDNVSEEGDD